MEHTNIKGYAYGNTMLEMSPVTLKDLSLLKTTLLWSNDDERYLRMAGEVLRNQVEQVLDVWYGYVGGNEHLLSYFTQDGKPNSEYLSAVRKRFAQWILDLCSKSYDQQWLNYQYEIAKRHHSSKKNNTDNVQSVPLVHFRYIVAFIVPITLTIRPFLENKGHTAKEVEGMYNAWFKAVTLTVVLWCYPYIKNNEF